MKLYVRESQVVLLLTKAEARFLLRGIRANYFQHTKIKDRILSKLEIELERLKAEVR